MAWTFALVAVLVLLPVQSAAAGTAVPLPPVITTDGRLGLADILPGSPPGGTETWARLAWDAGARTNRWEFRWDRIERQPGVWNFAADDPVVASDMATGIATLGILIGTPGWAAAPGQRPGNGVPAGLYLAPTDPRNLWATYVRGTVQHYAGQVTAWEIWNEPDVPYFWAGSQRDYFRLLKVADIVIRGVDPAAQVVMAGMVVPDLAFFSAILRLAAVDPRAQANGGFFDVAAWHIYGPARSAYGDITRMRALLARAGRVGTPVWVTEDGFPSSNPNGEPRQAAYVLQSIAYALAAGAQKVFIYRASDDPSPKTWGLLSASGAVRAGYVAFQLAAQALDSATNGAYAPQARVERLTFYTGTTRVLMLWARGTAGATAVLPSGQSTATLSDWSGQSSQIAAVNGQYRVVLPGASYNSGVDPTGSVVGGPPVLLTESDPALPNPTAGQYLPPLPGSARRLTLVNGGPGRASATVYSAMHPARRITVAIPPSTYRTVDLDLLAGADYRGAFRLSAGSSVVAGASSSGGIAAPLSPATSWSLAAAPSGVVLTNAVADTTSVSVVAYGPKGNVRLRDRLTLASRRSAVWSPPASLRGTPVALQVRGSNPLIAVAAGTARVAPTTAPAFWLSPPGNARDLRLFNPASGRAAHVVVTVSERGGERRRTIKVPAHASRRVFIANAQVAQLTADAPVVAGSDGAGAASGLAAGTVQRGSLTLAAGARHLAVYNPGTVPAKVIVQVIDRTGARQVSLTVGPGRLVQVAVRGPSDGPRGVLIDSTVGVAVAPVS